MASEAFPMAMLITDSADGSEPRQPVRTSADASLSSVEIFSGAGGLALGLELAGFRHSALVERDRDACSTLRDNGRRHAVAGHSWPVFEGDVRSFDYAPFVGRTTLLAGGAPCQPFSLGGLQKGEQDHRDLFPEVLRAVRALRPAAIFLENVRNLTVRSFREYFDYICLQLKFPFEAARPDEHWRDHKSRLDRCDARRLIRGIPDDERYEVGFRVLNSADFGVPQLRHRVFIIGYRRDLGLVSTFPIGTHDEDALLWSQWIDGAYWDAHGVARHQVPEMSSAVQARVRRLSQQGKPMGQRWMTLRDALTKLPSLPEPVRDETSTFQKHYLIRGARVYEGHTGNVLDRPAKTIKAGDHGNPGGEHVLVRPGQAPRYLSIRECARVQTFPDSYHFLGSRSECMRQLGNAVPVEVARQLGSFVHRTLRGSQSGETEVIVRRNVVGL